MKIPYKQLPEQIKYHIVSKTRQAEKPVFGASYGVKKSNRRFLYVII